MQTLMNTTAALLTVLGIFVVLALPALLGLRREARIDRELRAAQEGQNSSSKPTEPSTATWYAEGRRSKKLVSS
ncbi:hypothetical protein ACFVYF_20925 [Streptomyces sp. NPDC058274]|jgi:hypothetical protein|uniref:hypothetical protein n=1 Tax=Streptomyces sp. NPDC058274 TaxID=3346416 RepID=UPI0029D015F3|nr:hypothetical protein [Streptomyces sp.]